jgi:hypothetical protein
MLELLFFILGVVTTMFIQKEVFRVRRIRKDRMLTIWAKETVNAVVEGIYWS